jgi:hypothetical protein
MLDPKRKFSIKLLAKYTIGKIPMVLYPPNQTTAVKEILRNIVFQNLNEASPL